MGEGLNCFLHKLEEVSGEWYVYNPFNRNDWAAIRRKSDDYCPIRAVVKDCFYGGYDPPGLLTSAYHVLKLDKSETQ